MKRWTSCSKERIRMAMAGSRSRQAERNSNHTLVVGVNDVAGADGDASDLLPAG